MSTPLVSVIVPSFNRASTLHRAVDSVLQQSFRDLEVIVVDDASTDDSVRVLEELSRDSRVEVVHHATNRGAAAARNTGLEHARGRFVAFQDSDDRWRVGALARLVEAMERSDETIGVCYGAIAKQTRFGVQLVPGPHVTMLQGDLSTVLLEGNFIDLPATFIRREVFDLAGVFDSDLRTLEDWELLLRMSQVTRFRFVDAVLVDSADTPGGVNSLSPHTFVTLDRIEERHAARIAGSPAAQAQLAYLRGRTYAAVGDRYAMREQLDQAAKRAPTMKYRLASTVSRVGPGALETTLAAVKVAGDIGMRRHRNAESVEPVPRATLPDQPEVPPKSVSLLVPTRNAGNDAIRLLDLLEGQTLSPNEIVVIDSSSTDGTAERFAAVGATMLSVEPERFRHGAARNEAARHASGDILVFMTQDVVPAPDCIERLVTPLLTGEADAAYARQIAPASSPILERFARSRNYPESPYTVERSEPGAPQIGRFFFSNACSAVRADVFRRLGGFPEHVIMTEDMNFAATLLEAGGTIRYAADAVVMHGHGYLPSEVFRRYFDIGVALEQSRDDLRGADTTGAGVAYLRELLVYLVARHRYDVIPRAGIEMALMWLGHALGRRYRRLPRAWARRLSLHRNYWDAD